MKKKVYFFLSSILLLSFNVSCGEKDIKQDQTISFAALAPRNLSEGSFQLEATASSGLPVSFSSSDPTVAAIQDKTVTLKKKGVVTITASQAGNENFYEAPNVSRSLTVNEDANPDKKDQTITFVLDVTEWKSSQGELALEATASSGLPVSFSTSDPDIISFNGSTLILNNGTYENVSVVITASQGGNDEYNAAPNVSRSLSVTHDTH